MDAGEPPLENVVFMTGSDECVTGANGICTLEGVPAGNTLLGITAPANFRYITPDNITDVLLSKGYDISVTKDDSLLIPLAEGPYRNPFHEASQIKVIQWKDINLATCNGKQPDRTCGLRADWLGGANTYDGHDGTDIHISNAQKVYAMRKGEIHDIRLVTPDKSSDGYEVLIQDKNSLFDTNTSFTDIVHVRNLNPDIKLGSSVDPTTWIGTGASTLNGGKIHLSFYYDVPATRDPRDRPWITNPWNHCPFGEHLWVSLFQFGKIVNHDAIRDFDTIVRPPFLYIEGNIK